MLTALGIADEVEALQLKGTKKKKAKKLDEDFIVSPLISSKSSTFTESVISLR
jgi:hypothetical protein